MRYEYNRMMDNETLSKKMFEEYVPSFLSLDLSERYGYKRDDYVLILIVLCGYVSKEELVLFTGMSHGYCEQIIHRLIKKSLVESIPLKIAKKRYVSRACTLYTFTKKGYDAAKSCRGGQKIINDYRKKKANPKNAHDYVNGMNLLSSLIGLKNLDFTWIRERVYGNYMRGKNEALAVDCEIILHGFTLHIEEDINNEMDNILLDKLLDYQKYPTRADSMLRSAKHAVLFSYYVPEEMEFLCQRYITSLAKMVEDKEDGLLLEDAFRDTCLSPELSETLNSLYDEAGRKKNGQSILKVGDLKEMSGRFLSENPFYQNAFKKDQYRQFIVKRERLSKLIYTMEEYVSVRDCIYEGAPVYICPTLLFERYVRLICDFKSYAENLESCLGAYFGKLSFREYSPMGNVENSLILRNRFSSSEGGAVYVEYPTIDMGALLRIRRFMERSDDLSPAHHLIILVDRASEALKIAKQIKDFDRMWQQIDGFESNGKYAGIYRNRSLNDIYYLKREDLEEGRTERLFYASGYREEIDNDGNVVEIGENEICYLYSESNPAIPKKEGF